MLYQHLLTCRRKLWMMRRESKGGEGRWRGEKEKTVEREEGERKVESEREGVREKKGRK